MIQMSSLHLMQPIQVPGDGGYSQFFIGEKEKNCLMIQGNLDTRFFYVTLMSGRMIVVPSSNVKYVIQMPEIKQDKPLTKKK